MFLYDRALDAGTLVKPATLAEAFKSGVLNDGEETGYGFGWYFDEYEGRGYTAHDGEWLGFQSFYVRFPEQQLTVIILLNRSYDLPSLEEVGLEVAGVYLRDKGN
jgi:CubicO group peptidase (beta-lactamase class C family)